MSKLSCSKNKIATLLFVAIIPLFLTACSLSELPVIGKFFGGNGGGGPSSDSGSLTIWGLWENPEVMNAMITKFNEKYPGISVTYDDRSILKPLVEYKERVFRRATEEDGTDVMRVHISWLPALKNSLVPMPSSIMDVNTFRSSFYPAAADNLVFDNQIYGMPAYYDGLVLVYNKDHFEEIGQREAPTAWEEFRRLALELTIRGENDKIIRGGAAVGNADNIDFFSDIIGMLFAQAKINYPADMDNQAAQDALSFYTNFVLEDGVWSADLPEASVAFSQGKVSMIFVPTWNLIDIIAARPDMNIGVAPVPQALPSDPSSWASFWVDVVPKSSKNANAAWNYISFMAAPEQQMMMYSEASKYRSFGAPYSLVSLKDELSTNPYIKPLLDSASYAKTSDISSRAGNRKQEDAIKAAINEVIGGKPVGEALTTAKTAITQ